MVSVEATVNNELDRADTHTVIDGQIDEVLEECTACFKALYNGIENGADEYGKVAFLSVLGECVYEWMKEVVEGSDMYA